MTVVQRAPERDKQTSTQRVYRVIREELMPHFAEWARCGSTAELNGNRRYKQLKPLVREVLETPEMADFRGRIAPPKAAYRFVAWNLERGIEYEGQLAEFKNHPYLASSDVLLLTETDVGMARSANRAVAQDLARELGMCCAFVPCYLNLAKGAGIEHDFDGENEFGLHGNAILSRYPIRRVRPVRLSNGKDKMAGREKRLGRQTALAAEIEFPNFTTSAVSVHLDAQSSQRHRRDQMCDILAALPPAGPAIIGGDWNTTTYNSSRAFRAIMGFWLRVFMGVDNVIGNHYLHPYNRFEKDLFALLESREFDYRRCNKLAEHTTSYDVDDVKTYKNLREWVPAWCFRFIRWALRNHDGKCPLKIDWFATRGIEAADPVVMHEFREGRARPLSDHDAIGVDVSVPA